jgi:hypothetical protein
MAIDRVSKTTPVFSMLLPDRIVCCALHRTTHNASIQEQQNSLNSFLMVAVDLSRAEGVILWRPNKIKRQPSESL